MSVQFVSAISASPTVRLDLDAGNWTWLLAGTDLSPPPLRRAYASTLLVDGAQIPAAAYDNRTVRLALQLQTTTADAGATQIQALARELNRPTNILKWHPEDATSPVFFRTFRAPPDAIRELRGDGGNLRNIDVEIPAEPFAYGLEETVSVGGFPFVVTNNPAEAIFGCFIDADVTAALNADPGFETSGVPDWTCTGGTLTRDNTQQHSGTYSGKVVPDGVTSIVKLESTAFTPVTAGEIMIASGWVRCDAARAVDVNITWYNGAQSFLSTSSGSKSVAATTWTQVFNRFTAPANAAYAKMQVAMSSTPPASHVLYADEVALIRPTAVKGDVETPAVLTIDHTDVNGKGPSVVAVRRRGTPSATPLVLQAEAMTAGTDTSIQANDAVMSGSGQNYMRCTFGTTAMTDRLTSAVHPSSASVDARGLYRVYLRYRRSSATGGISVALKQVSGTTTVTNTTVALATSTDRRYADLGLVQIPFGADPVYDGYSGAEVAARGTVLVVRAERTGSGNLDMDCLLLVPADDRLSVITWPASSGPTSMVVDGPLDMVYPIGSAGEIYPREHVPRSGLLPMLSPGQDNRIFFLLNGAATGVNDSVTSTVDVTLSYWPRYLYVRPATT